MPNLLQIMSKLASNPALVAKIKATKTPEEIVQIAKENGMDLTVEDVKKALSEKDKYAALISHLK